MTPLAVGLASGLGNAVFMLPAIRALKQMGHRIHLHVQTDFPTVDLWKRCTFADEAIEATAAINGHRPICGQWRPAAWAKVDNLMRVQANAPYLVSEWQSNMRLAKDLGFKAQPPIVSNWCKDLDRSKRWDVGIVPGSKSGVWMRKRYPGMAMVANHFLDQGMKVAVFGQESDGVKEIPGEHVETSDVAMLPDVLAGCRVIVGTDSGPTHLASSLGIPVVVIFTATSSVKGDPVGRPARKVSPKLTCFPCQSTTRWGSCTNWKCQQIDPMIPIRLAEDLIVSSPKNGN